MKWTEAKVAELRELAPTGMGAAIIASRIGATETAVNQKAGALSIPIARHKATFGPSPDGDDLRKRWAVMIGPMKAALRADLSAGDIGDPSC